MILRCLYKFDDGLSIVIVWSIARVQGGIFPSFLFLS